MVMVACITAGSVFAINGIRNSPNNKDATLANMELIKEQRERARLMEDLANLYNNDDSFEFEYETAVPTYEIYDADDNLIFAGNSKQWNDERNEDLVKLKMGSELLFESGNTQVFKIF